MRRSGLTAVNSSTRLCLLGLALGSLTACRGAGAFVWVDEYATKVEAPGADYRVAPGDLLNVRVWNQEAMSSRATVRADGKISLPFLNDVDVVGKTPPAIAEDLQRRLTSFIVKPTVTVSLEEAKPLSVSVMGEVNRPGLYTVEPGAGLLRVLAMAGGFAEFADRSRIFVLRPEPGGSSPTRIRVPYDALIHAEGQAAELALRAGDAVIVE